MVTLALLFRPSTTPLEAFWGLAEMKASRLEPVGASVSDPGRCDRPVSN
jgi:hypothetical protein